MDDTARSAREILAESRRMVDAPLRAAVDTLPESIRRIVGYHFGWWDADGTPVNADNGKAIRPSLVLLCAKAVGGDTEKALPAAVAVELVHNFTLIHDDIIDRDTTRRHRPTAWSVFGDGPAILAGDALSVLATDVLAASGHPAALDGVRMLAAAVQSLIDGQHADVRFADRSDIRIDECDRMAAAKTGALLACSCALGARFGGADDARVRALSDFGDRLGLAFQHVDDLLGIWGDPHQTGKPVHSDLRNRKKSLPVVAALSTHTPATAALSQLYSQDTVLSDDQLARAASLVDEAGGREWSQSQSRSLLEQATADLWSVTPEPEAARDLEALAALMTRRDR